MTPNSIGSKRKVPALLRAPTWRHDGLGEAGPCSGGDGVAVDAVLLALDRQRARQPHQAHLRRAVVRLAEVAVNAGGRRGHDDPGHRRSCEPDFLALQAGTRHPR